MIAIFHEAICATKAGNPLRGCRVGRLLGCSQDPDPSPRVWSMKIHRRGMSVESNEEVVLLSAREFQLWLLVHGTLEA